MNARDLFGGFGLDRFIAEHLHRLPLALPNVAQGIQQYGSWNTLGTLLAAPSVEGMVVKDGQRHDDTLPTNLETAQRLCDEGCTIVLRHTERNDDGIAGLADAFETIFHAPVDVHFFVTPPGNYGFSWHYDAEDVFIFQTGGAKEYLLRKNTVNPWPLEETLPADMRYERELMPLMRVLLQAGDMLYIPCGFWHCAQVPANSETAISLAVGVMSRSAMDLFALLREELLQSLVWRQRLPVLAGTSIDSEESAAACQYLLSQLADDAARTLRSPTFLKRAAEFIAKPGRNEELKRPDSVVKPA
jgi:50S ribosomal protein L16 3-hydroxylase